MKKIYVCVPVVCAVLLIAKPLAAASPRQLVVDDDKKECPKAGFTRIQDAVNAASPGDEIRICKGTYVEQVTIDKALDIDADSGAVLMPTAMKANTSSLFDASPIAAALLVTAATSVSISGLTVDGAHGGISECTPDLIGIFFRNASGEVDRVAVRNFKLSAALNGCQSGTAIFVQSGSGGISEVRIHRSSIHDFQKNGITANEIGTTVAIDANAVTGLGPTRGAAQNGIQIGFGAGGSITNNSVSNNVWAPCTAIATCATVATDILVEQSDGVEVSGNRASVSQVNVFVHADDATIFENQTWGTLVFDGVRLEGSSSRIRHNNIFDGAEAGIFLSGNNNVVADNIVTEAAIGILKAAGSTGNIIAGNLIFDAPITVQDPAEAAVAKLIQPKR
jgi:parallel beta-helix repeat protein